MKLLQHRSRTLPTVVRALGWFSIALGIAELLAPGAIGRGTGIGRRSGLVRAYGLREVLTGVGLLTLPHKVPWLWARTAGDLLDLATIAAVRGRTRNRALAAAAVTLVGIADTAAALRAQRVPHLLAR